VPSDVAVSVLATRPGRRAAPVTAGYLTDSRTVTLLNGFSGIDPDDFLEVVVAPAGGPVERIPVTAVHRLAGADDETHLLVLALGEASAHAPEPDDPGERPKDLPPPSDYPADRAGVRTTLRDGGGIPATVAPAVPLEDLVQAPGQRVGLRKPVWQPLPGSGYVLGFPWCLLTNNCRGRPPTPRPRLPPNLDDLA
jgi:hypothetical protein